MSCLINIINYLKYLYSTASSYIFILVFLIISLLLICVYLIYSYLDFINSFETHDLLLIKTIKFPYKTKRKHSDSVKLFPRQQFIWYNQYFQIHKAQLDFFNFRNWRDESAISFCFRNNIESESMIYPLEFSNLSRKISHKESGFFNFFLVKEYSTFNIINMVSGKLLYTVLLLSTQDTHVINERHNNVASFSVPNEIRYNDAIIKYSPAFDKRYDAEDSNGNIQNVQFTIPKLIEAFKDLKKINTTDNNKNLIYHKTFKSLNTLDSLVLLDMGKYHDCVLLKETAIMFSCQINVLECV